MDNLLEQHSITYGPVLEAQHNQKEQKTDFLEGIEVKPQGTLLR